MHSVPLPITSGATTAAPPKAPDPPDGLPEARFRGFDELLAWLEEGDHVEQGQGQDCGMARNANVLKLINPWGKA
jgi:hypothetical protein